MTARRGGNCAPSLDLGWMTVSSAGSRSQLTTLLVDFERWGEPLAVVDYSTD
jgi:hypothetical protein